MKLKKILASLTAAAMAVTTMAFAPVHAVSPTDFYSSSPGSNPENFEKIEFFSNSSAEMANVDLSTATQVKFYAVAYDLNYGWNNAQFYVDGNSWNQTSFGGTNCNVDLTLSNPGAFETTLDFEIKPDGAYAVGAGSALDKNTFAVSAIDVFAGSQMLGRWSNEKWYDGNQAAWLPKDFYSSSPGSNPENFEKIEFFSNSSAEMANVDLSTATQVKFYAVAYDLNYGWNNAQFYVDGNSWKQTSFGGTNCNVDLKLSNPGAFETTLDFEIKPDGTYVVGAGSALDKNTFGVYAIDVFAGTELLGTWSNHVWIGSKIPATSITVSPATAELKVGETTTVTATVEPANTTDKVVFSTSDEAVATVDATGVITAVAAGTATITATAGTVSADCVVTVLPDTHTVTVSSNDTAMGTATADVAEAAEGDTVTLTAEPAEGCKFVKWETTGVTLAADDVTSETASFEMPASDVTAKAVFEEIPAGEHAVTVKTAEGGTASASLKSAIRETEITLTVKPAAGYEFDKWIVSPETVVITDNKFTMPDEAVTVTPVFKKTDYTVTVETPENGTLSVDKTTAQVGDTVTVTAVPDKDYSLSSISVNGKVIEGSTFEMPAGNVTVSALFTKTGFAVKVEQSENGTVTVDKANAQVGDTVTVTATPAEGYKLDSITVNGKAITGNTFTMPAENAVVSAKFTNLPGEADAEVEAPEGVEVAFPGGTEDDVLAAVFGNDYEKLVEGGKTLDVVMTVKDETSVPEADKALVEDILSDDMKIGLLLDVELFMTVDTTRTQLSSSLAPIVFTVKVPEAIIAEGRSYYVARVHDGKAAIITEAAAYNSDTNTITVSSDKFSTYAIIYEEKMAEPEPEPVYVTVYYSVITDGNTTASTYSAAAGTSVSVRTNFGYDAEVYCGGSRIASLRDGESFIMPSGNVSIISVDNGYFTAMKKALPNSYIFIYDSEMNYIKTNGSTRGIDGEGKITVKLGEEYAGKTVTLYKGRKSTDVKITSKTLNDDGNATFTVGAAMNYTAVVE